MNQTRLHLGRLQRICDFLCRDVILCLESCRSEKTSGFFDVFEYSKLLVCIHHNFRQDDQCSFCFELKKKIILEGKHKSNFF